MADDAFIHDSYVQVSWPVLLLVAFLAVLVVLIAIVWSRRR
jgi:hypothetical protein